MVRDWACLAGLFDGKLGSDMFPSQNVELSSALIDVHLVAIKLVPSIHLLEKHNGNSVEMMLLDLLPQLLVTCF